MRTRLITGISLILIIAAGCQKRSETAAASTPAPATAAESETTTPSMSPTVDPMVATTCPVNSTITVDANLPPVLAESCVSLSAPTNNSVTWQGTTGFKVEWVKIVPSTSPYPYPLTNCSTYVTNCPSGNVVNPAPAAGSVAYYKVSVSGGAPPLYGRIIIRP